MATAKKKQRRVTQPRKAEVIRRLNRISGQVNGLNSMVNEDRYCVDILTQISACRSALDAVAGILLEDHATHCVMDAAKHGQAQKVIGELVQVFRKYR